MKTSIFVEQRTDAPAKVQSGTFAVIYPIKTTEPNTMRLTPIIERAKIAPGLDFNAHIRPTRDQMQSSLFQLQIIVIPSTILYRPGYLH